MAIAHGMHLIVNVQCCSAQWYYFLKIVCVLEQAPFMQDVTDSEIGSVETDLGTENGPCNKVAQEETPALAQEEEPIAADEAFEPQAPTVVPDNILQESGCLHNQDGNKIVTDDHKTSNHVAAKVSLSPSCLPL